MKRVGEKLIQRNDSDSFIQNVFKSIIFRDIKLSLGLIIIGLGLFTQGPVVFTERSDLAEIKGTVELIDTGYEQIISRKGYRSVKSSLTIKFIDTDQHYIIYENIGRNILNERFERIKRKVRRSEKINVLVKESRFPESKLKVYEVSRGVGDVLYSTEEAKQSAKALLLVHVFFGLILFLIYYADKYEKLDVPLKYTDLFRKISLRLLGPALAIFFGILSIRFALDELLNFGTLFFGLLSVLFVYGSISFRKYIE